MENRCFLRKSHCVALGILLTTIVPLAVEAQDSAAPSTVAAPASASADAPKTSTTDASAVGSSKPDKSTNTSGDKAEKTKTKAKADLPNFHQVHPFLYRGGEPSEQGLGQLKKMGVGTIIDLRAPSEMKINEKQIATRLGLNYINLVMDSHAPTTKQVDRMLHEIDNAKEASDSGRKNQAVFIHCAHGSDRTGCMVGIYRVTREHWNYPDTYQEMRKYYFTPKFTKLSGAVEEYAKNQQ